MSQERIAVESPETELTLGLPGGKRCFSQSIEDNEDDSSPAPPLPPAKCSIVGWPPVRSYRKKFLNGGCKYVKVAVDGAPYLRKLDLQLTESYEELLSSLGEMFRLTSNFLIDRKMVDSETGLEYVPTYEDKDGDWMLVGDVPWKMFVETCKRLRMVKKGSDEMGLGPRRQLEGPNMNL